MLKRFGAGLLILAVTGTSQAAEVAIDGSIRVRETIQNNLDFDGDLEDANNFASMRTRVGLSTAVGEFGSAFIQLQDSRVLGEPVNTVTSLEQVDMHQAYILVTNVFNSALEFQLGRMEMAYGKHRQIGSLGWNDNGRSFDGVRAMYEMEDTGWFHLFAMKTKETGGILAGVNDGAGITQSASGVTGESAFLGAYAHLDINENAAVEGYLFDSVTDLGDLSEPGSESVTDAIGHRFTVGGRARWRNSEDAATALEFHAEGAVQFGSSPEQLVDDQIVDGPDLAASAFVAEASAGLPGSVPVTVGVGFDFASGDGDATDDELGTYSQLFPTGHAVLGIIDFVGWQNVTALSFLAKVVPDDRWSAWAEFHLFQVVEAQDAWYGASGAARLGGAEEFDSDLGQELDLSVRFKPEPNLTFAADFALWFPGSWQEQATALAAGGTPQEAIDNPASLDSALAAYVYTVLQF